MRGPGPEERKLSSRIFFKVFGHWPQRVVKERLDRVDANRRAMEREYMERRYREYRGKKC